MNDYEKMSDENKWVGNAGEELVLEYEREKTKAYSNKGEVIHASKLWGDGLGYDIRSFDEYGNYKFIEVKTTQSSCFAPFYITANELLCSKNNLGNFYLYRLYNYNPQNHAAEFYERTGSLEELCVNPVLYKAITRKQY
jgi:hypothetical protein